MSNLHCRLSKSWSPVSCLAAVLAGFIFLQHSPQLKAATPDAAASRVTLPVKAPYLDGHPVVIARNPEVGEYATKEQQPVDFNLWQAADGTWQLWSCIRNTKCGGKGRLFHRWEGKSLSTPDWKPMGIAMEADPSLGELPGGLQAPYVFRHQGQYHMLYGDWVNICLATSSDGKEFQRTLNADGTSSQFTQGLPDHIRDPMAIQIEDLWYVYYTGNPNRQGKIFCRTTPDFRTWSEPTIVASGGRSGDGRTAAECPHVIKHEGHYYLFRTEKYGRDAVTHVYVSTNPLYFGIDNDDDHYVTSLPIAAPEYIVHEGKEYLASLKPELDGIRIHYLKWRNP